MTDCDDRTDAAPAIPARWPLMMVTECPTGSSRTPPVRRRTGCGRFSDASAPHSRRTHTPCPPPMSQTPPISTDSSYNTAHLVDDRNHLYVEYGIDPAFDGGCLDPDTGSEDAPQDYSARREAIVDFYGQRCGRCCQSIAHTTPDDEESLGHVLSLGSLGADHHPYDLDGLVALCRPCYDLITTTEAEDIGRIEDAYQDAPQFPSWLCDPRVAVERAPLTPRELWLREYVANRVTADGLSTINSLVTRSAALALDTPASVAVAYGEQLTSDDWTAETEPAERLADCWEQLDATERAEYERNVLDPRTIASTGRWRADGTRPEQLPVGTAVASPDTQ